MTSTIVLHNAQLIDGTGRDVIADAVVIIEAAKIVWAGSATDAPEVDASKNPVKVDLCGNTITPGFFDVHVHLSLPGPSGGSQALMQEAIVPPSFRYFEIAARLEKTLAAGVTTVRDLMGTDTGVRLAAQYGLIKGSRLLVADKMLSQTGGHADWHMGSGVDGTSVVGGKLVDSVDEARKAARELLRDHVDVIKIASSGGVTSMNDDPTWVGMRTEMVAAIVEEGKNYGNIPVAAHAIGYGGIKAAVEGGVHSVEHGYEIDDDLRQQMVQNGQFLVPTLLETIRPDTATPQARAKSEKWHAIAHESVRASIAAGIKVAVGTDAGLVPDHGDNLGELPLLVEYGGMTPMEAIVAGTKTSAECCRVDDILGTVEAGKLADIVVIDGDPLQDISLVTDSSKILLVMKDGHPAVNRGGFTF
ncbi:amidohydrolase family protein [Leucobacter sp. HY1910]